MTARPWGMTEEDSSSSLGQLEDRNPKVSLSPKTSSNPGSSPTDTQGALDRRNTANRSVSGNRRSRGWNPAEKSSKNISETVPQGCILSPSLHPVRHFRDSGQEDSCPWTFEFFINFRILQGTPFQFSSVQLFSAAFRGPWPWSRQAPSWECGGSNAPEARVWSRQAPHLRCLSL